ncbi:MAG: hypothetical protein AAF620_18270 [Bacteroidota bacterium]
MAPLFSISEYKTPLNQINQNLHWYTWSKQYKEELLIHARSLSEMPTVIRNIFPKSKYGYSYDIVCEDYISPQLENLVEDICSQLFNIDDDNRAFLLHDLLFDEFDKNSLASLITVISNRLRRNILSYHSPVKEQVSDVGFPVHADLFGPRALFIIMTNHQLGNGGDILLVKKTDVIESLYRVTSISESTIEFVKCLLENRYDFDGFDICFRILHGNFCWQKAFKEEIRKKTVFVSNRNGYGYFVEDGEWLHGRTRINGKVNRDRFQRLVFDTKRTLSKPFHDFLIDFPHRADKLTKDQLIEDELYKSWLASI